VLWDSPSNRRYSRAARTTTNSPTMYWYTASGGGLILVVLLLRRRLTASSDGASKAALPQSTLREDVASVRQWFANLIGPTLRGRPACKPTMPAVIPTVVEELKQVMDGELSWTFVDCGCGQGTMLQPMRNATVDGRRLFQRVVGVELDPATHREAVAAHNDPAIEVVCGDMFPFVDKLCAGDDILGGCAVFYIYEPLWMANLPAEEMRRLYGGLLDAVARHPGSVIAYCSADAYREIGASLLEEKGLVLRRAVKVAQNGAFNKLRGVYNPLEFWQVPRISTPPTSESL